MGLRAGVRGLSGTWRRSCEGRPGTLRSTVACGLPVAPPPPESTAPAGLQLWNIRPAPQRRQLLEQAMRSLQQTFSVSTGPQSGNDTAAAPEANTPANLDLDTRVCQVCG